MPTQPQGPAPRSGPTSRVGTWVGTAGRIKTKKEYRTHKDNNNNKSQWYRSDVAVDYVPTAHVAAASAADSQ